MAKLSQVLRDKRRKKLIAKHAERRAELRKRLNDRRVSIEEKLQIQEAFAKLPRNSCPLWHCYFDCFFWFFNN